VELVCERGGERLELELGAGHRLWIPPGAAHRIEALEPLTVVEFADRADEAADDIGFEF
jgi:quercetin dioxygenase-like cupin family protein